MEHAYAEALMRMLDEGTDLKEAVRKLRSSLQARGREALLPRVARAFAKLSARKRSARNMMLYIAREQDAKPALREAEKILTEHGITDVDLCQEIDDSLIGGWRLEGHGLLVDSSWKNQLVSLYNAATK